MFNVGDEVELISMEELKNYLTKNKIGYNSVNNGKEISFSDGMYFSFGMSKFLGNNVIIDDKDSYLSLDLSDNKKRKMRYKIEGYAYYFHEFLFKKPKENKILSLII